MKNLHTLCIVAIFATTNNDYTIIVLYMNDELRVTELMKLRGMTQTQLAEKMGISRVGLAKAIGGNTTVSTLRKLADALEVPLTALFKDTETFFAVVRRYGQVECFEKESELIDYAMKIRAEVEELERKKKEESEDGKAN